MATRTHARTSVVGLLYAYSVGNTNIRKFAPYILEQDKIRNKQAKFAIELFDGTINNLDEIDKKIQEVLTSWDVNKLGIIDKCIIRLSTYEMLYNNLDAPVSINEAIEIAKILGNDDTPKFVNGVLDGIVKTNNIKSTTKETKPNITKFGLKIKHAIEKKSKSALESNIQDTYSKNTNKHIPKLCIALDMASKDENVKLCKLLASHNINDVYMKIGLRSFIRDGIDFINTIKNLKFKIFLDLKLYDIPNTMVDSINEIANLNVDIVTIHASSGKSALSQVVNAAKKHKKPPLIFSVSALTSFNNIEFEEIYKDNIKKAVEKFAKLSSECGVDGIVCSCDEGKTIKDNFSNLLTLTPGIRPSKDEIEGIYDNVDDQNRVSSIAIVKESKSDFIVIGRPIYKSNHPEVVTKNILDKLKV